MSRGSGWDWKAATQGGRSPAGRHACWKAAGLVALLFGFAAWQPVWIVAGVCAIVLSCVIYRKRYGRAGVDGSSERGGGDSADGGANGGGGD